MLFMSVPVIADTDIAGVVPPLKKLEVGSVNTGVSRSGDIHHPFEREKFRFFLTSGDRAFIKDTLENNMKLTEDLRAMDLQQLEDYVTLAMKSLTNTGVRHVFEKKCAAMAMMAEDANDNYMMEQVITIIYTAARESVNVPITDSNTVYHKTWQENPSQLLFAYDIAYYNPYWDKLSEINGVNSRAEFEKWIIDCFDRMYAANVGKPISNYGGYWLGQLAGIAVVLRDPDRIRKTIELLDQALRPSQFFGDGMWREGTFSYGQMLVGNCAEAVSVLKLFKDPEDYVDTKFNLNLDYTDLTPRWPIINKYIYEINNSALYPNGAPVAMNDNHYNSSFTYETPIKAKYLKNNELNHFGLYSMKYGNLEEAQQINLKFAPMSEGGPYSAGHSHGDFLGLSMWSAGMEILPDGGYVNIPAANRYVHMNAAVHNCSWVYSPQAEPYNARGSRYVLNNTLAYDDGSTNGKQVQLLEAESRHTPMDGVDMKRRAVMLVAVDENHSYTVDIQRLKGGTVHENFLRQVEEEDVMLTTNLTLPEAQEGTLGTVIKGMGKSGGIALSEDAIKSPQIMTTDEDIEFIWKGKDTGVSMHAHLKGNKDTTVAFSQFPTMRRVNNVVADKDKYPGYHFYQRQDVTPDDITIYGGVYEGYREGEAGNVKSVKWIPAPDGDELTQLVRVELPGAVDYIYISNDYTPRKYNDITFSGEYAIVRMDTDEKKILWHYLYGDGSIRTTETELEGANNYLYQILAASGRLDEPEIPNQFRVKGVLPENIKGLWGRIIYGDGSGVAFEITNVDQSIVSVHNSPGFGLEASGAVKHNFPAYVDPNTGIISATGGLRDENFRYQDEYRHRIQGNVWFEVKTPTFVKY